jgi:diguanylate cyclase (GGDEF)-like protein
VETPPTVAETARRLRETVVGTVRASDTVARIGGDEFVVIIDALDQGDHATLVAEKIRRNAAKPFTLKRHKVNVTVTIGIGLYPENGKDADVLLGAADYAMYLAKAQGKNRVLTCPVDLPGASEAYGADR